MMEPAGVNNLELYQEGEEINLLVIAGASQASAIIFGGEPGTTYWKSSETWNGTSWTEGNNA